MLRYSVPRDGAIAIRYPRGGEGGFTEDTFTEGGLSVKICEGKDICIVTYGTLINNVLSAFDMAKDAGKSCTLLKLNSIKPLDSGEILKAANEHKKLIIVEEVVEKGSVYEQISALCSKNGCACKIIPVNAGDSFTVHGKTSLLYNSLVLDAEGICKTILEALKD